MEAELLPAHRKEKSSEQWLGNRVSERILKANVAEASPQDGSRVAPHSASEVRKQAERLGRGDEPSPGACYTSEALSQAHPRLVSIRDTWVRLDPPSQLIIQKMPGS
jgi:hypothetical protein